MEYNVHHFGFLTSNLEKSLSGFEALGWRLHSRCVDHNRGIELAIICKEKEQNIELIMPLHENAAVKKSASITNNFYHICYEVENLKESINYLKSKGYIPIKAPEPAVLFQNRQVVFLISKYSGMIELLEK